MIKLRFKEVQELNKSHMASPEPADSRAPWADGLSCSESLYFLLGRGSAPLLSAEPTLPEARLSAVFPRGQRKLSPLAFPTSNKILVQFL